MKRILLTSDDNLWRRGGPVYLLDWVQNIPRDKYKVTAYFSGELIDRAFAREFTEAGVEVHTGSTGDAGRIKKDIQYIKDLHKLLAKEKYDIINIHSPSPIFCTINLFTAWRCGVPCRIPHSHTSVINERKLKRLYYYLPRAINKSLSTKCAGVSKAALEFIFGKGVGDKAYIISPRIDTKKFSFSNEVRDTVRQRFSLGNDLVVGHVGAFSSVKNHIFLVDVFKQVAEKNRDAKLMLIGTGEDEKKIRAQVHQYGLDDRVIFVGPTEEVQNYLCAMDCFVLPSLREGFPIVLIEAQASGLPCIASDVVPSEEKITDLLQIMPLEEGAERWADEILAMCDKYKGVDRSTSWEDVMAAGYDVNAFRNYVSMIYE